MTKSDSENKAPSDRHGAKAKQTMVRISLAVALLMPMAEVAQAQFALNCTRSLQYDSIADCGGGSLTITPATGNVNTKGCIVPLGTPLAARCSVKSFATSGSIKVQVLTKKTDIKGPGSMRVTKLNVGTIAGGRTFTWTSASLTKTPLVFDVGARLLVSNGQAQGAYSGKLMIRAQFTP